MHRMTVLVLSDFFVFSCCLCGCDVAAVISAVTRKGDFSRKECA